MRNLNHTLGSNKIHIKYELYGVDTWILKNDKVRGIKSFDKWTYRRMWKIGEQESYK